MSYPSDPGSGTRKTFRKPDPNYKPGETLPVVPAGTYRAVITNVRLAPKPQRKIDYELARGKTLDQIHRDEWIWTIHIKSKSQYNVEVRAYTNPTLWITSTAYRWVTALLHRDLDDNEDFDVADLAGERCMVQLSVWTSQTGKTGNNVDSLTAADEDADWDTSPPPGWSPPLDTGRPSAASMPAPAPTAADTKRNREAVPPTSKPLSEAQRHLLEIAKTKGMTAQRAGELYTTMARNMGWGQRRLDELEPDEASAVFEYFEAFDTSLKDEEGNEVPF